MLMVVDSIVVEITFFPKVGVEALGPYPAYGDSAHHVLAFQACRWAIIDPRDPIGAPLVLRPLPQPVVHVLGSRCKHVNHWN